jgi:hypothetical protein
MGPLTREFRTHTDDGGQIVTVEVADDPAVKLAYVWRGKPLQRHDRVLCPTNVYRHTPFVGVVTVLGSTYEGNLVSLLGVLIKETESELSEMPATIIMSDGGMVMHGHIAAGGLVMDPPEDPPKPPPGVPIISTSHRPVRRRSVSPMPATSEDDVEALKEAMKTLGESSFTITSKSKKFSDKLAETLIGRHTAALPHERPVTERRRKDNA